MSKIQQERPELLANIFPEPIKFLPISSSCRELIDVWLQVSLCKSLTVSKLPPRI